MRSEVRCFDGIELNVLGQPREVYMRLRLDTLRASLSKAYKEKRVANVDLKMNQIILTICLLFTNLQFSPPPLTTDLKMKGCHESNLKFSENLKGVFSFFQVIVRKEKVGVL